MNNLRARQLLGNAQKQAFNIFDQLMDKSKSYDFQYMNVSLKTIIAIGEFKFVVPAIKEMYKDADLALFFDSLSAEESHFFKVQWDEKEINHYVYSNEKVQERKLNESIKQRIFEVIDGYENWAGFLDENGDHIINLRNPVPGPHFYTNMLLGNRMLFSNPLQTTPKSVVDRFGGGSFRAHAATQVLATRWDMLPEENGFPCNRQFYLVENGKQIFYSADVLDSNIKTAVCKHSKNHTQIEYTTKCGLHIKRIIFLLPQYEGLPIATEVQRIIIKNLGDKERKLKVVFTGMMGSPVPGALMEDVVYSTVIMESGVLQNEKGEMLAYVPHYYPQACHGDVRFATAMFYDQDEKKLATELCTNYSEFIGNGSLYHPEGVGRLPNRLNTKGPGFYALGREVTVGPSREAIADSYIGLISNFSSEAVSSDQIQNEIRELHNKFVKKDGLEEALEYQLNWYNKYRSFLQVKTNKKLFDTYVNQNLPFQVLYQTFVSRSFDLTQKGYREIGFREIQDIYASMYYFISMGDEALVKELLREWIEKVFEYGYCYHNFFWKGKEAGKWSDDGLWLVQAVYRYIQCTGDISFLDEQYEMPEANGRKRSVYDTLKAIIHYSRKVSVGKHGLPLIDYADWNDCLKVDEDYLTGPEKEKGDKSLENYSESIMNGFLLQLAISHMYEFAKEKKDLNYAKEMEAEMKDLSDNLQKHAWKEDFFARVLFNRYGNDITYLGAHGDGFSGDKNIEGTYFLNSFSWSILANEAKEHQIEIMLKRLEEYLKQPYGLSLMSPTDLSKVAQKTATGEYFPGDRENGGIFKHATMMATAAMLKAAKEVQNPELAKRLRDLAYWMVNIVLPYNTLENPFFTCGNPRWCTQYVNSQTGEHIGPTLSGTSTWLTLTLFEALGIQFGRKKLILNPMLENDEENMQFTLKYRDTSYSVSITKPTGLYRIKDNSYKLTMDGKLLESNEIALVNDKTTHQIELIFS